MGACMLLGGKHIDKNSTLKKTKIVMAIPFDNIPQKDILMVEKEVNKIVEKKLGIQVQFVATASYSSINPKISIPGYYRPILG